MSSKSVVVLGASPKRERFSNKALRLLQEYGHEVIAVNPAHTNIENVETVRTLEEVSRSVDTVTVYLGEKLSLPLGRAVKALKPKRVIFNPGAENDALEAELRADGINVLRDCTLVMLRSGTF